MNIQIAKPKLIFSLLVLLAAMTAGAARAEDATAEQSTPLAAAAQKGGAHPTNAAGPESHKLPPDSVTRHTLELPGRKLAFSATAGSIRLFDDKGDAQADIGTISYQLEGTDRQNRPVTFVFNGGPGAASAWLQLGNNGPWRLAINADAVTPSTSPELQPNAETWLDFTDLVFIDPVGTGYSRFIGSGEEARKKFYSVDGDVASIAVTVRRWLEKNDRLLSPKYIVGESYGGIRGPKLVNNLQTQQGIGISGLILLSPVFDFREFSGSSILQYVASLPSFAAVAREREKRGVTRADMRDVEDYARTDFVVDLLKGEADVSATNRLADKVAELTGIDRAVSRRVRGRFGIGEFRREFDRGDGKVTGRYDGTVLGLDPYPDSSFSHFGDQSGDALTAPLSSAAVDLITRRLNWRPDGSYELLNPAVERSWEFGRGLQPLESVTQLRQILALDPKLKVLVAHGLFDLATPYFGSQIVLDQLPPSLAHLKLVVYPGGHMFYSRDGSRQALRAEVEALMK